MLPVIERTKYNGICLGEIEKPYVIDGISLRKQIIHIPKKII